MTPAPQRPTGPIRINRDSAFVPMVRLVPDFGAIPTDPERRSGNPLEKGYVFRPEIFGKLGQGPRQNAPSPHRRNRNGLFQVLKRMRDRPAERSAGFCQIKGRPGPPLSSQKCREPEGLNGQVPPPPPPLAPKKQQKKKKKQKQKKKPAPVWGGAFFPGSPPL